MTDSSAFTPAQAADPGTSAQDMARIAAERPDLWPSLAANPSLYPDLRQWLRQVGGEEVQEALTALEQQTASMHVVQAENRGAGETAPPPPPPTGGFSGAVPPSAPSVGGFSGAVPPSAPSVAYASVPPPSAPSVGGFSGAVPPSAPSVAYASVPPPSAPPVGGFSGAVPPSAPSAAYASVPPPSAPSAAYAPAPLAPVPPTGPKSSNTTAAVGIAIFLSVIVLAIGSVVLTAYSRHSSESRIETLQTSCRTGHMADCDSLYYAAGSGSSDEFFGKSCGGRDYSLSSGGECRSTYGSIYSSPSPSSLYGSSNSSLRDSCSAGDMDDCDSLYYLSSYGSADESFGKSCGGRNYSMRSGGECKSTYGSRY